MKYEELPLRKRIFKWEFWKPKTKADYWCIGFGCGFLVTVIWLYLMELLI